MKIPNGLKKAKKEVFKKKSKTNFDLNKICFLNLDDYSWLDQYNEAENDVNKKKHKGHELVTNLCRKIAKIATGYEHSSDLLDNSTDKVYKEFVKKKNLLYEEASGEYEEASGEYEEASGEYEEASGEYEEASGEYEEASDSIIDKPILYRGDYYEFAKETFKEKIDKNLGKNSLVKLKEFKDLYNFLVDNYSYNGSKESLEIDLKKSEDFSDFCKKLTTNYSG